MGKCMDTQVNKLLAVGNLEQTEFQELLKFRNRETTEYLNEMACNMRLKTKQDRIQLWGRIPVSSFCKYDCKMCGIRRGNQFAKRYRMDKELILECCQEFAKQGIQSFLLESGDDVYYTQKLVEEILIAIKKRYPHSRIILSLGEKPETAYRNWLQAGADSYLLRHGSADETHFRKIYPADMSLLLRKQQLWQLKGMGYHTGTGFLVGIPYQSIDNVVEDMQFIKSFGAAIIDVGAFVPALHSVFERERSGNGEMTAYLLAILRLMLPDAEIIASPTLDCVLREGRMKAVLAGADVLVVDLAETAVMESYRVYDRKNGRMALPLDNIEGIKAQLTGMGLSCEDGGR